MTGQVNIAKRFGRQLGFFNPEDHPNASATFVGVGGIGSFAAFATAKLGIPNITLIDPDTVEEHNAPNQLHAVDQIGTSKVEALATEITSHIGTVPTTFQAKIEGLAWESTAATGASVPDEIGGINAIQGLVVSGLDSMTARQDLWGKIAYNPAVPFYIDGRIAGKLILIYALNPCDPEQVDKYEATLHSDDDAEPATCTERGLIDVGFQCGALITRHIRHFYNQDDICPVTYVNQDTMSVTQGDWL